MSSSPRSQVPACQQPGYGRPVLVGSVRAWTTVCILAALSVAIASAGASAQVSPWQPSPGHEQVPIWPGAVPDAQPAEGPEATEAEKEALVAGKPWVAIRNVSRPTMTIYPPRGKNTGVAVVVFPGGGYQILAIDLEGTEVCDWLTSTGITCVLLKYRVPRSGPSWDPKCRCHLNPKPAVALQDAQRTLGLVRLHAAEWHVDPRKIGVMGFSAGGHLVAAVSTDFKQRSYPKVDAADDLSCRPDFAVAVYPGHLWDKDRPSGLNPDVEANVSSQTPPTFLLQAQDDRVDPVEHSLGYYRALRKAKVPVELHLYPQGGHAFGLRRTTMPITGWPQLVETWLAALAMTTE